MAIMHTTCNYNTTSSKSEPWIVKASNGASSTTNPIRELIETMNLSENPQKKVIPLSIGDPTIFGNLKPCQQILDALSNAIKSGKYYGYQTASGMELARDSVANYHNKLTGNNVKRRDVILTSGCSHAIDLSICVLASRGQNILIPRPGFPLYKTLTSVYGINFKQYNLNAHDNWSVDLKHLESLIDNDTAAIIVNNPSNPCGSVYSKQHLLDIISVAERYRKPIIADEIYDKFVFNQQSIISTAAEHESSSSQPTSDDSLLSTNNNNLNCVTATTANGHSQTALTTSPAAINNNSTTTTKIATVKKTTKPYTDPSLVKCPNRRYRYNGDDGPERQDLANQTSSSGDDDDYFEETDLDDIGLDMIALSDTFQSDCSLKPKRASLKRRRKSETTTNQDFVAASLNDNLPFIALSSLTKTVPILTCGGISKTCLIPGLRLGWIIINDLQGVFDASVRDGLGRLTQRIMGPSSLVQGALPSILENVPPTFYAKTMQFIRKNARICYNRLSQVAGLHAHLPQGTMYLMVGFDSSCFPNIADDLDFTSKLMNEQSVLVLPGMCFDIPNYFRICLTVPSAIIEEALSRIQEFCCKYYVASNATPVNGNRSDRVNALKI